MGLFHKFGAPVVLKITSPHISHKSEVDGVRLNLKAPEEVTTAFDGILARARALRPDALLHGVTVEPMVVLPDARELLIGVRQDSAFGPVLTFGAGGTLVELLDDIATALLPLSFDDAHRLISATKIAKLLGPFRNWEPIDMDALAELLVSVSGLALALPRLAEMDINPLIASPKGFCAVDARIRIATPVEALLPCETH